MQTIADAVVQLQQSRHTLLQYIQTHAITTPIYVTSPVWHIGDVVCHIAFWENEGTRSLHAHARGQAYHTPDFSEARIDHINHVAYTTMHDWPADRMLAYAQSCRTDFLDALHALDDAARARDMRCPWDAELPILRFVAAMIEHEQEHCHDIRHRLDSLTA